MFTGIIEELGVVKQVRRKGSSLYVTINAKTVIQDVKTGDSIAVNGVCLTVTDYSHDSFSAEVSHETLDKSYFKGLKKGDRVNLERALKMGDRLMGHMVSGHIDGTGVIVKKEKKDDFIDVTLKINNEMMKYVVTKGSVAVDGVSLTVANRKKDVFRVSIIPHSARMTTFGIKREGSPVNIECDLVGKYIENFLSEGEKKRGSLSKEFLKEHGFI
jgi:riboflavin synthase